MKQQAGHRDTLSTKASAEEIAEATRRWWAQRQQEARAQGRRLTYAQAGKALASPPAP